MQHNAMREALQTLDPEKVPGLRLLQNFVTCAEEQALLAAVQHAHWQVLAKRRVCHFGHAFDYLVWPFTASNLPIAQLHPAGPAA